MYFRIFDEILSEFVIINIKMNQICPQGSLKKMFNLKSKIWKNDRGK